MPSTHSRRTARTRVRAAPAPGHPDPRITPPRLKDVNHPIGQHPGIARLAVILIEPFAVIGIRQPRRPGQPRHDGVAHARRHLPAQIPTVAGEIVDRLPSSVHVSVAAPQRPVSDPTRKTAGQPVFLADQKPPAAPSRIRLSVA